MKVPVSAVFEGICILPDQIVNAKFSPEAILSDEKLETVTTWPDIEHDVGLNPDRLDRDQVPVVSVNADGNVITTLPDAPDDIAVAACKLNVKLT